MANRDIKNDVNEFVFVCSCGHENAYISSDSDKMIIELQVIQYENEVLLSGNFTQGISGISFTCGKCNKITNINYRKRIENPELLKEENGGVK